MNALHLVGMHLYAPCELSRKIMILWGNPFKNGKGHVTIHVRCPTCKFLQQDLHWMPVQWMILGWFPQENKSLIFKELTVMRCRQRTSSQRGRSIDLFQTPARGSWGSQTLPAMVLLTLHHCWAPVWRCSHMRMTFPMQMGISPVIDSRAKSELALNI